MIALFKRDLALGFKSGGGAFVGLLFFLMIVVLTPFALGPDLKLLSQIGPGILWIGAVLATMLGLDRLFKNDLDDGSLAVMQMQQARNPLFLVTLTKCAAHWCVTCLPLIIATPLYGLLLNMGLEAIFATALTLLMGTPAIILIGSVAAAVTVTLPRGGLLISILVLPLIIPIVIFGLASAERLITGTGLGPMMMLGALTLFFAILGPLATGYVLTHLDD